MCLPLLIEIMVLLYDLFTVYLVCMYDRYRVSQKKVASRLVYLWNAFELIWSLSSHLKIYKCYDNSNPFCLDFFQRHPVCNPFWIVNRADVCERKFMIRIRVNRTSNLFSPHPQPGSLIQDNIRQIFGFSQISDIQLSGYPVSGLLDIQYTDFRISSIWPSGYPIYCLLDIQYRCGFPDIQYLYGLLDIRYTSFRISGILPSGYPVYGFLSGYLVYCLLDILYMAFWISGIWPSGCLVYGLLDIRCTLTFRTFRRNKCFTYTKRS